MRRSRAIPLPRTWRVVAMPWAVLNWYQYGLDAPWSGYRVGRAWAPLPVHGKLLALPAAHDRKRVSHFSAYL